MICTGVTPVLVNRHESVVSPIAGSHSAFAVYTADGVAGDGATVVVVGPAVVVGASVVAGAGTVVGSAVVVVGAAVVGAAVVGVAVAIRD